MKKRLLILFLLLSGNTHIANAEVSINTALTEYDLVNITGLGFGSKTVSAPVYNENWDDMPTGQIPVGWINTAGNPAVSTTKAYSGTKAVEFINIATPAFQQIRRDMGTTFQTFVYRGKLYYDDSLNTLANGQWKFIRLSSSPGAYYISEEETTSIVLFDSWWNSTNWFNNGSPFFYSSGTDTTLPAPANLFPRNRWYDFTLILKRSSAPNVLDAQVFNIVDGVVKSSSQTMMSHGTGDGEWRYMLMGGTIDTGLEDTENIKIYYDDFYVDNTLARVELCVGSSWSARGNCDVQPAITWNENAITANFSKIDSNSEYLYVVNENGEVNETGYSIVLSGGSDTTPPTSPQGLSVL